MRHPGSISKALRGTGAQGLGDSPTISRMVTGWGRVAGSLRPAMLTPTTLKMILAPVGRFLTVKPQRSTGWVLAGIHSSAAEGDSAQGQGIPDSPGETPQL